MDAGLTERMLLSCSGWSNATMRCRYAPTSWLQFRRPSSMAVCACAMVISTTGTAGAPDWQNPCCKPLSVTAAGPRASTARLLGSCGAVPICCARSTLASWAAA